MADLPSEQPVFPWLHIGDCPVCGDGLCRIRCCIDSSDIKRLYAICDECETIWLQPDTRSERFIPEPENPKCPFSNERLYGPHSRWATTEDIRGTPWESETIVELPLNPTQQSDESSSQSPFVTSEDFASPLDIPTMTPQNRTQERESTEPYRDDLAYGQDEPRPGC